MWDTGTSYVAGKALLDHLLVTASHAADQRGRPFVLSDAFAQVVAAGIVPPALIENETAN